MSRVPIAGASLFTRVDRAADAGAGWVVLSNGLAADHGMWAPQMAALTRRHHVLRYDTRGHGASDAPPGPYAFDHLVGDVVAILDHHRIDRAVFMGLSLGGMTGLGLALQYPGRLSGLICCDARADAPEAFVKGWADRVAAIERGGMAAIAQGTIERWFGPAFRAGRPDTVAAIEATFLSTSTIGYKGCAMALMRLDYLKRLDSIRVPSLFVVGANDVAAAPDTMRDVAGRVPGAALAVIPDASHLANIENAAAFNDAVLGFLDRLQPERREPPDGAGRSGVGMPANRESR
jgi:3-oxoadipate enol-lactonase